MKVADDVLDLIGNTPLVRINNLGPDDGGVILAKLESANPGSCVKDRIAKAMIDDAIANGTLKPGMTIVEPTSGNTGIGLAMACAVRKFRVILTMPDTMSLERRQILRLFGAEIELTPGSKGMLGAIEKANELVDTLEHAWMPQQFNNPSNPTMHENTTAEEIWKDTDGKVDILVAGVGTGGTLTGCARKLKSYNPDIKIIAVEPTNSAVISGEAPGPHKIQGIGAGFIPKNLDTNLVDSIRKVDNNEAGEVARKLALEEGIFCGVSSGAAMLAAIEEARHPENKGKNIVAILPDTGERYLSTWLFEQYRC